MWEVACHTYKGDKELCFERVDDAFRCILEMHLGGDKLKLDSHVSVIRRPYSLLHLLSSILRSTVCPLSLRCCMIAS